MAFSDLLNAELPSKQKKEDEFYSPLFCEGADEEFANLGDVDKELDSAMKDVDEEVESEDGSDITMESFEDLDVFTEGAQFSFFPRFKSYAKKFPDLKKYEGLMQEADEILNHEGEMSEGTGTKIARVCLKILGVLQSIDSVLFLPFCIFITPIIPYLMTRLWKYAFEFLDYSLAEKTSLETISKLKSAKKNTDDPKAKAKIDNLIEKIEKNLKEMRKKKEKKSVKEQAKESVDGLKKAFEADESDLLTDPDEMGSLTNQLEDEPEEQEDLERAVTDADIEDIAGVDDLEEEELTPEEEMEADNLMQLAATTALIQDEMNPDERAEFAESAIDTQIAINEGFLLDSDIEMLKNASAFTESKIYSKTKVQFNKDARMAQLHAIAVNVCAQSKNDPDYIKLKKLNRARKILRARLTKKYGAAANRLTRTYYQRLRQSKSPALQEIAKKAPVK